MNASAHKDACAVVGAAGPEPNDNARAGIAALLKRTTAAEYRAARQAVVLGSIADLLGETDLQRALDCLVAGLQRHLGAERVVFALCERDGPLSIGALSGQALVDLASAEVRLLLDALQETLDLERSVCFPERVAGQVGQAGLPAHRALAGARAGPAMLSVPFYHGTSPVGAMLVQGVSGKPYGDVTVRLIEHLALACGPLIALRREAERSAMQRGRRELHERLAVSFGSERPGRTAVIGSAAVAVLLMSLVPVAQSVVAEAEIVPQERRLLMAPIDGFVDEVAIAAGESVVEGQVLARFDQRELELELAARNSEIDMAQSELRAAMALHDRKATAAARARLQREQAGGALLEQRIARSVLRSPMDGVVISGDPSRVSGVPVARGDTLFEVAPADGYEVHLLVAESAIGRVSVGQPGALALRTAPDHQLALSVSALHPVGESADGATRFRVRAVLDAEPDTPLRPGQSGTVRLEAGSETVMGRLLSPLVRRLQALRWKFFG